MLMNKLLQSLFLCLTLTCGLVLNEKSKSLFVQINQKHMLNIFNSLQSYSTSFASNSSCNSEKHMYVSIAQNLREGKIYSNKNTDRLFLGWTPLTDDKRMLFDSTQKPIRNDNIGTTFRKIPLYFLICEEINETETLVLHRIYYNPTIDIKIDLEWFRTDLENLAKDSKQMLDITPLKLFDNGRWYLILSNALNILTDTKQ